MINEREIYRKAIETYGINNQITVFFEEVAELEQAICKNMRGYDNGANIAEEIADTLIMLGQLVEMYGNAGEVAKAKEYKLDRLKKRLGLKDE